MLANGQVKKTTFVRWVHYLSISFKNLSYAGKCSL